MGQADAGSNIPRGTIVRARVEGVAVGVAAVIGEDEELGAGGCERACYGAGGKDRAGNLPVVGSDVGRRGYGEFGAGARKDIDGVAAGGGMLFGRCGEGARQDAAGGAVPDEGVALLRVDVDGMV